MPGVNNRPTLVPLNGSHERLTSHVVIFFLVRPVRSAAEEDGPPFARRSLYKISMPRGRDGVFSFWIELALSEDWILLVREIRTVHACALEDNLRVLVGGPPFGTNQIIHSAFLEDVRPLDPDRFLRDVRSPVDEYPFLSGYFETLGIEITHPNRPVSIIERFIFGRIAVIDEVRLAVVVKKE